MKKLKGFMGLTHVLLSLCVMMFLIIIPFEPLQMTFGRLRDDWLLFIVCMTVLAGGALLPDLDNDSSSAGATLGPIGGIMTVFMKSTSSVVWNMYHLKGDRRPTTQHRYLWHSPILWAGLAALFYFGLPTGNYNIFTNLKNSIQLGQFGYFMQTNALLFLFIILSFEAVLVGSNMIVFRISKIFEIPYAIKYIFPALVLIYIFMTDYTNIRVIGVCLAVGCVLHCIEDAFCDSGLPSLIFPIPQFWRNQVWGRMKLLPITVTTGGMVNTVIDFIATGVFVFMIFVVFKK